MYACTARGIIIALVLSVIDLNVTTWRVSEVRDGSRDVTWDPPAPQKHCLDRYFVTITDSVTKTINQYYTTDRHLTLGDPVEKCTEYNVTVSVSLKCCLDQSTKSESINFPTNPGNSAEFEIDLSVNSSTSSSILLAWQRRKKKSCSHGQGILRDYSNTWSREEHTSQPFNNFTGRKPCSIRGNAVVSNLTVSNNWASLEVSWQPPYADSDCDLFYMVQVIDPDGKLERLNYTHDTTYTFTELQHCIQYQVAVTVMVTGNIPASGSVSQLVNTTGGDLSDVRLSVSDVTGYSATVALVDPEERAVCLGRCTFTVSWAVDGHVSNTTEPQPADQPVLLHRLAACSNYSVQARIQTESSTTVLNGTFKTVCKRDDQEPDTSNTRQPRTGGCVLPAHSLNRRFCAFKQGCEHCTGTQCVFEPGVTVLHPVKVTCEPGFGLSDGRDRAAMVCEDGGTWHESFPTCVKLCPPLKCDSLIINCMNGVSKVDCDKPIVPGTTAEYHCRPSHSKYPGLAQDGLYDQSLRCKQDGTWHGLLYPCQPACGISKGNSTEIPTIVDGKYTKLGEFPWHAGLYRLQNSTQSWEHICGGSLITKSVVLTAAHCVFRDSLYRLHPSELRVALAKYYRSWTHQEEFQVKCEVSCISVALGYHGAVDRYALDIALVVLSEPVAINSFVMPVCIDHSLTLHLKNNTLGYVVGWGKTSEGGVESETLLHSELAIINETRCRRHVRGSYFGNDKFCAIKESATGSVVQPGDSGGGLTTIGVGGLHFIVGITSIKINNFSLFTNVSWNVHQRWLEEELQQEGIH